MSLSIGWILFYMMLYETFFYCFVGSVDSFLQDICRHLPTAAGSLLEAQSVHPQAPILPVGTLVSLPKLWHFNGARILALRNQQFWEGLHVIVERRFLLFKHLVLTNDLDFAGHSCFDL